MKTYSCRYTRALDGESLHRVAEIDAESAREAYEAFMAKEGSYQIVVQVDPPGIFSVSEFFKDHIGTSEDKKLNSEAIEARVRFEREATNSRSKAHSSLTSTDMLLHELIKEQKQTNEWLKKVRWSLLVIHIIMVLWFVFGWVIRPI